jgi:hypothetical protein
MVPILHETESGPHGIGVLLNTKQHCLPMSSVTQQLFRLVLPQAARPPAQVQEARSSAIKLLRPLVFLHACKLGVSIPFPSQFGKQLIF